MAEELRLEEARSMLENAAWLQRERLAQEEFRKKQVLQEQKRREKEEREVRKSGGGESLCQVYISGLGEMC